MQLMNSTDEMGADICPQNDRLGYLVVAAMFDGRLW